MGRMGSLCVYVGPEAEHEASTAQTEVRVQYLPGGPGGHCECGVAG